MHSQANGPQADARRKRPKQRVVSSRLLSVIPHHRSGGGSSSAEIFCLANSITYCRSAWVGLMLICTISVIDGIGTAIQSSLKRWWMRTRPRLARSLVGKVTDSFTDNWEHEVLVERIDQGSAPAAPRCIAGPNACPPEDCGGVFGYRNLLESLTDPDNPNHEEARDWVGANGKCRCKLTS